MKKTIGILSYCITSPVRYFARLGIHAFYNYFLSPKFRVIAIVVDDMTTRHIRSYSVKCFFICDDSRSIFARADDALACALCDLPDTPSVSHHLHEQNHTVLFSLSSSTTT
jgi:hypothetical protein